MSVSVSVCEQNVCGEEVCGEEVCEVREETPAVATSRQREMLWLREVLLDLTKPCRLIQREPSNALARFVFSSMLTSGNGVLDDPLLPRHESYDRSLCNELRTAGIGEEEVCKVCRSLCEASREAAVRVEATRLNEAVCIASSVSFSILSESVHLVLVDGKHELIWQNDVVRISAPHLYTLTNLYNTHCLDDANKLKFNRRLFCCLKLYEAIGGPTYQCSVTSTTFCALETVFGDVKECFASPFNKNSSVYWSAFPVTDRFFGSQGDFFRSLDSKLVQEGGVFYANPPFVEEYLERLREAVEYVLELPVAVTFAIMLPTWTDTTCYAWMQQSKSTQLHLVLAAGEHEYVDGRQQVDTTRWRKRHIAPFSSSFFVLQNKLGRARFDFDDDIRRRIVASFRVRKDTVS